MQYGLFRRFENIIVAGRYDRESYITLEKEELHRSKEDDGALDE
jgi:hypothetical protein